MSDTAALPMAASEMLEALYQHRLLSTGQLREMHAPHASPRWVQHLLAELAERDLVRFCSARSNGRGRPMRLWYLSERGADVVEAAPGAEDRRIIVSAEGAAGQLQSHTLAVNDVGIAFMLAARERGDECEPSAWRHEVAHEVGPGRGRRKGGDLVIADALLKYMASDSRGRVSLAYRFIELDRGTLPVDDLAAKFDRYARLASWVPKWEDGTDPKMPLWQRFYRTFPAVLVVFAHKPRATLERRMQTVMALASSNEVLSASGVGVFFTLLEDLEAEGPFAPVFRSLADPRKPVDWEGRKAARSQGAGEEAVRVAASA